MEVATAEGPQSIKVLSLCQLVSDRRRAFLPRSRLRLRLLRLCSCLCSCFLIPSNFFLSCTDSRLAKRNFFFFVSFSLPAALHSRRLRKTSALRFRALTATFCQFFPVAFGSLLARSIPQTLLSRMSHSQTESSHG